jgi:cysteinyl-tRNA synthetase
VTLRIYNYLSRKQESFRPIDRELVRMYDCGPTVYDHSHLGHAKTYLAMDVILRYLRYCGYNVRYICNFTDVGHLLSSGEDRVYHGANRESKELLVADAIRDSLLGIGPALEDGPDSTHWHFV